MAGKQRRRGPGPFVVEKQRTEIHLRKRGGIVKNSKFKIKMENDNVELKIEKIRHSLAHLLALAVLKKYPNVKLGIGPTIENGFYYDFDFNIGTSDVPNINKNNFRTSDVRKLTESELPELEKRIRELIKQNLQFKKETVSFAEAKKLFSEQPYKLELIKELMLGGSTSKGGPPTQKLKSV